MLDKNEQQQAINLPRSCNFQFVYEKQFIQTDLNLPLYDDKVILANDISPPHHGTSLSSFQQWLQEIFTAIDPASEFVVGILPLEHLYSPILPLLFINNLAVLHHRHPKDISTNLLLVVNHVSSPIRSFNTISECINYHDLVDSSRRKECGLALVHALQQHNFIRIQNVPNEIACQIKTAYRKISQWLDIEAALPTEKVWKENKNKRCCVGFTSDCNRKWLQMRQPLKTWPPTWCDTLHSAEYFDTLLELFQTLYNLSRVCFDLMSETLDLSTTGITESYGDQSNDYGSSVLRVYKYDPKAVNSPPSCNVHADLGLLTLAPVSTCSALWIYQANLDQWLNVEDGCAADDIILFAGETLGLLTNGLLRAPLHYVESLTVPRMSMPFFLRARPEANLLSTSCKDFMENVLFKQRAWRRNVSSSTPDY